MRHRRLKLALATTLIVCLAAAPRARAEVNRLFDTMPNEQPVRVIVSGWIPFTDMPVGRDARRQAMIAASRQQEAAVQQALQSTGQSGTLGEPFRFLPFTVVETTAAAARQLTASNPGASVEVAELRGLDLMDTPAMIGAIEARKNGLTGKGQVVAVLDTGVDTNHPFLKDSVIYEACFSYHCPNGKTRMLGKGAARPVGFHGTHVAGIIAGHGDAFSGVAPEAKIIAIDVFSEYPSGDVMADDQFILAGFDLLMSLKVDNDVPIVSLNMSLGGGRFEKPCADTVFDRAARIMGDLGMLVVASSGNNGFVNAMGNPGCAPHIISVGAVDKKGLVAKGAGDKMFSNSAPFLTIMAPGVQVVSSVGYPGKIDFMPLNGTSMAAPHVAGALALMAQALPNASPEDLLKALLTDAPMFTDPRNGVKTPMLHIPAGLRAASDASADAGAAAPPAAAPPAAAPPSAAPPTAVAAPRPVAPPQTWGSITQ